jgi:DNA-binding FrmR family transcriptional regulator
MRADKQEVPKRLNYIKGHLGGIRKMVKGGYVLRRYPAADLCDAQGD